MFPNMFYRLTTALSIAATAFILSACGGAGVSPSNLPIPHETKILMQKQGLKVRAPILMRIFKRESELEIWKQRDDGRYSLLKTYPICKWSGGLGPKLKQGDKQAPEGFYMVSHKQMNPNSSYHLSFNLGYPNRLDKSYGRTGDYLMVHGDCRSAGCYAMTDVMIEEIYAIAREAFRGGQKQFQVQAMPFRMTDENMQKYALTQSRGRWYKFWKDLKKGYDAFEMTTIPPKIDICERRYLVNAAFSSKRRFRASEICPPHKTFVPQIMETPNGPKIVQAFNAQRTYARPQSHHPLQTDRRQAYPRARLLGTRPLASPQNLYMRNSLNVSR